MTVCISNDHFSVQIDTLGAELTSVVFDGKQTLWQNENGAWRGHAPLLFPVCGMNTVVKDGRAYPAIRHGFAQREQFELQRQGSDYAVFCLTANEKTKAFYPYDFRLTLTYRLVGNTVTVCYDVENLGDETLYFSYGGHESFLLDPQKKYSLCFPKYERFLTRLHDEDGRLTGEGVELGSGKYFHLEEAHLASQRTLIFGDINSDFVTLYEEDKPVFETKFEGIDNLLLWTPMVGRCICIEPWFSLPENSDERKEMSEKGFLRVEKGACKTVKRIITYF